MATSSGPGATAQGGAGASRRGVWVILVAVIVVAATALGAGYCLLVASQPGATSQPPANRAPVAVIQSSDPLPQTYENVTLNATASYDPEGGSLSYTWLLPDGSTSNRVSINYSFASVGVFRFSLTVTDPRGASNTTHLNLTVHPAPLRVGTNPPFYPFEMLSGLTLEGFDIDLANAVAVRAGYAPNWTSVTDFPTLLHDVGTGYFDIGASAIQSSGSLGLDYNRTLYFSDPYFVVPLGILVNASDGLSCAASGCTAMTLANRTLAVQSGSAAEEWVDAKLIAAGLSSSSDVMVYTSVSTEVAALQAGTVEVVLTESYAAQSIANGSGASLRVAGTLVSDVTYAFAFPRTTQGMLAAGRIDAALQAIVQDGTYDTLYVKWFAL